MKKAYSIAVVAALLVGCEPQTGNTPSSQSSTDHAPTLSEKEAVEQKVSAPTKQSIGDFFVSTMGAPIGWTIIEAKGFYCRFLEYSGTRDYVDRFNLAVTALKEEGTKTGANAFVNLTISSESHEIQGSKWHSSIVHICGDFVVIR